MQMLNSGMDWLHVALQEHLVIWLAGAYLAGIVSGILVMRRKKKKD